MNISFDNINAGECPERAEIRHVCRELEGVFVGMLLKQGMRPAFSGDDQDGSAGNEQMMDFAIEQTAAEIGRQGGFGIADMLYDELTKLY